MSKFSLFLTRLSESPELPAVSHHCPLSLLHSILQHLRDFGTFLTLLSSEKTARHNRMLLRYLCQIQHCDGLSHSQSFFGKCFGGVAASEIKSDLESEVPHWNITGFSSLSLFPGMFFANSRDDSDLGSVPAFGVTSLGSLKGDITEDLGLMFPWRSAVALVCSDWLDLQNTS